jgi:hypothetical protein
VAAVGAEQQAGLVMVYMTRSVAVGFAWAGLLAAPLLGQAPAPPAGTFSQQLGALITQSGSGFRELRADSIGAGVWRARYLLTPTLDTTIVYSSTTISVLARQHADGRPGQAVVGVFPLALVAPGTDSTVFANYRDMVSAALSGWQNRGPGNWSECADPRRGREVLLFPTRTASGEALLSLSITLHPDTGCT